MMIGMIQSQNVHLNGFRFYVHSRAPYTQSHQRRFRQWLSNRRTDILAAHHSLVSHTLSQCRWVDPHWQRGMSYLHSKYCLERFTFSAIF
ncbi:MAG: hypothetical protein HC790_06390 [Acaryochloridaceae cyanobacterium CSU_3_4]|nr:hypothetical protein [Acaryochloridaceae cyanobacterium CSU_3_4]